MTKKVLLVKPPERYSPLNFGTFSLAVLAAAVRHLCDLTILDVTDLTVAEAAEVTWDSRPDLIGVTTMGYVSVPQVVDFVSKLKEHRNAASSTSIVVGGHGASLAPEPLLQAGADAAVIGEGEITFRDILENDFQPGTPGTVCLDQDDQVIRGPMRPPITPLDNLPVPARDLIPPPPNDVYLLETSRGCPHACGFCEATRFYGRRWRPHTPDRVVTEIKSLVHGYEAMGILFADDNFAANPQRVHRICGRLREQDLPAFFMVSARADDLMADPELLPAMAGINVRYVCVGVETLDPDTAAVAGKPIPMETYHRAFERMRKLGVFSVASLIVGLPGETPEARACAVERIVEAGPDTAQFLPFRPFPGVPLAEGRTSHDPEPDDVRDAKRFTSAFYTHPTVLTRLRETAAAGGVRGALARGRLAHCD